MSSRKSRGGGDEDGGGSRDEKKDKKAERKAAAKGGSEKSEKSSIVKDLLASLNIGGDASERKKAPAATPAKKKAAPPKTDGYYDMDLPSSEDEEEADDEASLRRKARGGPAEEGSLLISASEKEVRKRREKEEVMLVANIAAKEEALKDDDDAFVVRVSATALAAAAESTSRDIKVEGFSVSAKGKELLRDASLTIAAGRRYGLVGPNGKGKSTLLRLLARRQIPVPDFIDVLLVEQEVVGDEKTALQAVVTADVELMALRDEEKTLTELVARHDAHEADLDAASDRLTHVYERMREISAASADARASKILNGLGFTTAMQGRATQSFSGGWRMRISLARALFIKPTLLLLDEPTVRAGGRAHTGLLGALRWARSLMRRDCASL